MNQSQPEKLKHENHFMEVTKDTDLPWEKPQPEMSSEDEQFLYDNNPKYTPRQVRVMLAEARTAEQERVVGILKVLKKDENIPCLIAHCSCKAEARAHNRVIECITEAIRNKELTD